MLSKGDAMQESTRIESQSWRPKLLEGLLLVLLLSSIGPPALAQSADMPRFGEEIYVIGEIPFLEPVAPGQPVTIRFGIGELEIETVESDQIRADLEVSCGDKLSEAQCEKYRSRLRLEPLRGDDGVEVRLVGLPKWKMRRLQLEGKVTVPQWSPLTVRMGIGEVDIRSAAESLDVAMGIGDLTVRVPHEIVGNVRVGTRIGDASIREPDGYTAGKRRMLVGARLEWAEGSGTAQVSVGLRIGDARVVLE
jgi:hypothetical protein